jgi:hypothetical protein
VVSAECRITLRLHNSSELAGISNMQFEAARPAQAFPRPQWMHGIFYGFGAFIFATMASQTIAAETDPAHFNRAQSVINAFQVICQLELPKLDFKHIDQKATAMRMILRADESGPSAQNTVTRSKAWVGSLTDGPFALLLDEMSGAKGRATSCAITADVPDRDAFRAEAIRTMQLPAAPAPEFREDGSRSYFWDGVLGPGTTIVERDFAPVEKPGVTLKLLLKAGPGI